jgi:hypothetical protein
MPLRKVSGLGDTDALRRESSRMIQKYPTRVPIMVTPKDEHAPELDKHKYMTPRTLEVAYLMYELRKRLDLTPSQSLFLFTRDNTMLVGSMTCGEAFERFQSVDAFLHLRYALENVFGGLGQNAPQ